MAGRISPQRYEDARGVGNESRLDPRKLVMTEGLAMPDTEQVPSLSDDQLHELIGLLRSADTAELKLTVPDEGRGWRSTVTALGIDPMEASLRQVFFFDTLDL